MNRQFFFSSKVFDLSMFSVDDCLLLNVIRIKLWLLIKSLVKDAIKHVIIEFLILICLFCFQKMKSNFMHKTFECFFSLDFISLRIMSPFIQVSHMFIIHWLTLIVWKTASDAEDLFERMRRIKSLWVHWSLDIKKTTPQ